MSSVIKNRGKEIINLSFYNQVNKAICITDKLLKLHPPAEKQYVLRILIRDNVDQSFMLPEELMWVLPMLMLADEYQNNVLGIKHSFVYITVRHGFVESTTDDEWHVDGFSTKVSHIPEQNYIWCNNYPTEVLINPMKIPSTFDPSKHNLQYYIQDNAHEGNIITTAAENVYCIDPYVIHRRPTVPIGAKRTFVRISYVPIAIRDKNNTPNSLLPTINYLEDGVAKRNTLLRYQN
jgi:hypothetical protein